MVQHRQMAGAQRVRRQKPYIYPHEWHKRMEVAGSGRQRECVHSAVVCSSSMDKYY